MELILQHLSGLRRKSKLVHRQPNHCDEQVIILYVLPKHGPPVTNKVNIETFIIPTATGLRVHTSEEAETTPHQRDVQALPVDSDGDVDEPGPYQIPVVLQKQKKRSAPAPVSDSEVEVLEVEEKRQRKGRKGRQLGRDSLRFCSFLD